MLFFKLFSLSLISFFQAAVFVEVQPLIVSVMDGYNVCLFCYGQTGSGKTWTMVSFFILFHFYLFILYVVSLIFIIGRNGGEPRN